VRPDFHYHAPGGANLRGFARDLGGRWAAALNLEVAKPVLRWSKGMVREIALYGFMDAGVVDSMAFPSSRGDRYTTLYDGGMGVATRHVAGDLDWTMRVEFPLIVNRWDAAADRPRGAERAAFRWQVSLSPSF
jgi:hypothetical protein